MARCKITHQWIDGSATVVEAHVAETFADCLDECRVAVVKMWREVVEDEVVVDPEVQGE